MRHRGRTPMLQEGDMAPDLVLPKLGGGTASLHSLAAEGPVLLAFFKISCPVCQLTMPFLQRLHGVSPVVGISQDDARHTTEFNRHYGLTLPMLLDSEDDDFPAGNGFGITHVPTMFLVEPGGRIGRVIEGWNKKEMEQFGVVRAGDNVPAWKAG